MKPKVKMGIYVILMSFLILTAFGPSSNVWAKSVVLKFSDINAIQTPAGVFCEKFSELTAKKTQGRVKIQNFYGGTLTGNDIEGTQTGIADFSQHDVSELTDICKMLSVLQAPFLYKGDDQLYRITAPDSPIFKKINDCLAGSGVKLVTAYSWGFQHILTTKTPIKSQKDLKGLKIRVIPSKILMETMKAMGATPTPMSWGEVITSLVTGVIDGTGMPYSNVVPAGLHEITKYYALTGHNPTLSGIFMNQKSWDNLSAADQQNLLQAADEARRYMTRQMNEKAEAHRQAMIKKGMTLVSLDEIEIDTVAIREAVFDIYRDDWGDAYHEILEYLK